MMPSDRDRLEADAASSGSSQLAGAFGGGAAGPDYPGHAGQPAGPVLPSIALPKGGGAIRSIGEKFAANPVTGTATMSVPIGASPARSGQQPDLALVYDSGSGNGPFGLGWTLPTPAISRKTSLGVPRYDDVDDTDTFVLAGVDDLAPSLIEQADGTWRIDESEQTGADGSVWTVRRYRPRIEGQFPRIERWTDRYTGQAHWRSISRDNRTTVYGQDSESRVADPADPIRRVFTWLASESHDDKGNVLSYEYVAENEIGVPVGRLEEAGRTEAARTAARYLKRIRYGNRRPHVSGENLRARADWMFEVVLDYGDHDQITPIPSPDRPWPVREDPFSTYRAGFELRTYRLCRRILIFHHFPDEPEIGADCLVHSLDLDYDEDPVLSFLRRIRSTGWLRQPDGLYSTATLPPLEFGYAPATIGTAVHSLDADWMTNLPAGLQEPVYVWADLPGQALPGILTAQAGSWFYKPNLGGGRFGPLQPLPTQPQAGDLLAPERDPGGRYLADLAGDGRLDMVSFGQPLRGFFARSDDDGWQPFRPFDAVPNVDWTDPHTHLVDLTGDGKADLLLTEDDVYTRYPSLGEAGFGPPERLPPPWTEPGEPALVFSDRQQAVFFADLSGDGLPDLVRVRNGQTCYWPSVGYGRFGSKVTMSDAPRLDTPDQFDAGRLRMADIDGTGTADLVYLGIDGVRLFFNRSGNSWSASRQILAFPPVDELSAITVTDLLGKGTACLVWSSPLPDTAGRQIRYLDLMTAGKPHLLVSVTNNLGASTRVEYISSTSSYAADHAAGRPWATRLPFPVHCVARQETVDAVSGHRFVRTYSYHHGCFDPAEREFRGFGRVDQYDTESFEQFALSGASNVIEHDRHQPPVFTRTWYHPGIAVGGAALPTAFVAEYYHNDVLPERPPQAPGLPAGLSDRAYRDALYACKGLMLRQETYCPDGSALAADPYGTADTAVDVRLIQPAGPNRHACFLVVPREGVTYHYERRPADPRIAHTVVLDSDDLGNITKAASVTYPRRVPDTALPTEVQAAQARTYVTYSEVDYTNDVDTTAPPAYRLRCPFSSRVYELTGTAPAGHLFTRQELSDAVRSAARISFEQSPPGAGATLRLLGADLTAHLANDLSGPLPFGELDSLGLTHQGFRLALTDGLVAPLYGGRVTPEMLTATGYVRPPGTSGWWLPGNTAVFPANAASHFYLPTGSRDPFGAVSEVDYDRYDLLAVGTRDALGNQTTAVNNYRLLGPVMLTDPNLNRTAIAVDELGQVTAVAIMGKAGAGEGDTLSDPTQRLEYDLANWMNSRRPVYVHLTQREEFGAANTRFQESYTYTSGTGLVAMTKVKAEPGVARVWDPASGAVKEIDTTPDPRWIGNGRTVLDNKGNVVEQYQPYFSATPGYEDRTELVAAGVTPVMFYDPLGRCIRTERPDGTFTKVEFHPWQFRGFDPNDTVLDSTWYAERGSPDPAQPEPADPQQRAAWLAAKDADTPSVTVSDSRGQAVYHVADNGARGKYGSRIERDISGTLITAFDARNRTVAQSQGNLAGRWCHATTPEKGDRWLLHRVTGEPALLWDAAGNRVRATYDELSRPVGLWLTLQPPTGPAPHPAPATETLAGFQVYGEGDPDAVANNRRGRPYLSYDQAGAVVVDRYDFRYAPTGAAIQLIPETSPGVDWTTLSTQSTLADIQAAAQNLLDPETFHTTTTIDALGRPTLVTLADATAVRTTYNDGGFISTLSATIRAQGPAVTFIAGQDHDALGRRSRLELGNGSVTTYAYDPTTFRLTETRTIRQSDAAVLQDLNYVYDPVANIVSSTDSAQQTLFFANTAVNPQWTYEYDALYQLIRATGRESAALAAGRDSTDIPVVPLPHPANTAAMRNYTENYTYDNLGNITSIQHVANGAGTGWTTRYRYSYENDPADATNRLAATSLPGDPAGMFSVAYGYDQAGNLASTPHLPTLRWNYLDQLIRADLGGGGSARYLYTSTGSRIRKVVYGTGTTRTVVLQLGTLEIARDYVGDTLVRERSTVFISDASGRIARVDSQTVDIDHPSGLGVPVFRYEYGNHLDSVTLETDEAGRLVSYEEYHPFGTSAYRSGTAAAQTSLKRYRFLHRERDDETGFYQLGARYYAPWLGRWISPDPAGYVDGPNLYRYCSNNPVTFRDPSGSQQEQQKHPVRFRASPGRRGEEKLTHKMAHGTATPEEALKYFQTHGRPDLQGLPEWQPDTHEWHFPDIVSPDSGKHDEGAPGTGGGAATGAGTTAVQRNPEGETLEVVEVTPKEKMSALKERIITDRGVAPRGKPAGGGSRTADLRRATRPLQTAYENSLEGGKPPGMDTGHTVDLQLIGRHNDTVRPQDFGLEPSGVNRSQGAAQAALTRRQVAAGLPEDVPVGGVARTSQMGRLVNQPGFRTALRGVGYGLMVAGPVLTFLGASQIENRAVRYGGWGLAGAEAVGSGIYAYGRIIQGGGQAGSAIGRATMGVGGTIAGVAGGAAQALISGYMAYEDYQRGDMTAFGFDVLAAAGGVALIAAAVLAAGPLAIGLAIFGIATGVAAGIYHLGRAFNWWG
jgi:RHS repeat-associated protein